MSEQRTYKVLSLGAGVQSSCVLLKYCEQFDAMVFADTQNEPQEVYRNLAWLKAHAEARGVPVHIVTRGDIYADTMEKCRDPGYKRAASLPFFIHTDGKAKRGRVMRQCTKEYKLELIIKAVRREVLGLKPRQRIPAGVHVEMWIAISTDEAQRMRSSTQPWITNVYPLCDTPIRGMPLMSRADCVAWMAEHYPEFMPVKSECLVCPHHSDARWREIRDTLPDEWQRCIEFDRAIRKYPMVDGQAFLHASLRPLEEVDFSTPEEHGQARLDFGEECQGMCGL